MGCNHMRDGLQPYARWAATICVMGCNRCAIRCSFSAEDVTVRMIASSRTSPACNRTSPASSRMSPASSRTSPASSRISPASSRASPAGTRMYPASNRMSPGAHEGAAGGGAAARRLRYVHGPHGRTEPGGRVDGERAQRQVRLGERTRVAGSVRDGLPCMWSQPGPSITAGGCALDRSARGCQLWLNTPA